MAKIRVGTCSWTDPTLVSSGRFYPDSARSAEARLQYYASQFNIVEVDSSYYALPNERNSYLWAERTPDDFVFDFKAFRIFTQHPTPINSLPKNIRNELTSELQEKANIYYRDLPAELVDELWQRFESALLPLDTTGKLSVVLFQFPSWFYPGSQQLDYIEICKSKLQQYRLAMEFRNNVWLSEGIAPRPSIFSGATTCHLCALTSLRVSNQVYPPSPKQRLTLGWSASTAGTVKRGKRKASARLNVSIIFTPKRSFNPGPARSLKSPSKPARCMSCSTTATRTKLW